jgi:ferric-dicitrate binding protein FerR (iron transport regulator)
MHLSDREMARLIDDRVNQEERDQYLKHISTCEDCFELYTETLKSLEKEEIRPPVRRLIVIAVRKKKIIGFLTAAILMISIPFLWKALKPFLFRQTVSELTEILIPWGKKRNLALSDGTRILLDSGTQLSYPQKFTPDKREVFLNGEAYFNVTGDKKRPFVVYANHAVIEVVGTQFNVRAWDQTRKVTVAVAEGQVILGLRNAESSGVVNISKGQFSELSERGKPLKPLPDDIDKHCSWINCNRVFTNTRLKEVLDQLERWYDVRFIVDERLSASARITVHLQDMPITDIANLIADIMELDIRFEGQNIYLYSEDER